MIGAVTTILGAFDEKCDDDPDSPTTTTAARLDQPIGVAIDPTNPNLLYLTESGDTQSRVRRADLDSGVVTTLATDAVDNSDYYYRTYRRAGFAGICVSATGTVFALRVANPIDYATVTYEVWQIHPDGTHDVVFTHTWDDVAYDIRSVAASSTDELFLEAHGHDSTAMTNDYFNGILRVTSPTTAEVYAGRWGPDYNEVLNADGPRLDAVHDTSPTAFPFSQRLAFDSGDNLWVTTYRALRRISAAGVMTTPIGLIRDYSDDEAPIDPAWVIGDPAGQGPGGPGGLHSRTTLPSWGGTFPWAIATTWDTADQHLFTYDDYSHIHHAAINANLAGPHLSGERVIRDSPLGRRAASYRSHGMAYADGFVYFTERYGPTVRRLEVGGAGVPRALAVAGDPRPRVRRR